MADTVLTLGQLNVIFQQWTMGVLNTVDPSIVRVNWPTDGAPSWSITQDICFISVTPIDIPYGRQVQTDYTEADANNANVNLTYTDGIRVSWTLYGPDAFDNVGLLWSNLFTDSTKSTLASNNLALVTDVPKPIRVPELFNNQWWNRATFYATFNELVIRQSTVPYIQTANVQVLQDADVQIQEG